MIISYSRVLIFALPGPQGHQQYGITSVQFQIRKNTKLSCNPCRRLYAVFPYPYDTTLTPTPFLSAPRSYQKNGSRLYQPIQEMVNTHRVKYSGSESSPSQLPINSVSITFVHLLFFQLFSAEKLDLNYLLYHYQKLYCTVVFSLLVYDTGVAPNRTIRQAVKKKSRCYKNCNKCWGRKRKFFS